MTSANVACGFHAGDPATMRRVCARAVERGVVIGAQVSYRDLAGFGRRFVDADPAELTADLLYQVGALREFARIAGGEVAYLKPHGALYNAVVHHDAQARAVVEAAQAGRPAGAGPARVAAARAGGGGGPHHARRGVRRPRLHPGGDAGARAPSPARCCPTPTPSSSAPGAWRPTA